MSKSWEFWRRTQMFNLLFDGSLSVEAQFLLLSTFQMSDSALAAKAHTNTYNHTSTHFPPSFPQVHTPPKSLAPFFYLSPSVALSLSPSLSHMHAITQKPLFQQLCGGAFVFHVLAMSLSLCLFRPLYPWVLRGSSLTHPLMFGELPKYCHEFKSLLPWRLSSNQSDHIVAVVSPHTDVVGVVFLPDPHPLSPFPLQSSLTGRIVRMKECSWLGGRERRR